MAAGVTLFASVVLGMGDGSFLSQGEMIGVIIAAVLVAVLIVFALVHRRSKAANVPMTDSCASCGSMSMNHRAGLAVCMDCGASVKIAGAEAE